MICSFLSIVALYVRGGITLNRLHGYYSADTHSRTLYAHVTSPRQESGKPQRGIRRKDSAITALTREDYMNHRTISSRQPFAYRA